MIRNESYRQSEERLARDAWDDSGKSAYGLSAPKVLRTQCAWCLRFTKDGHAIGHIVEYAEKDLNASHGICNECFQIEMARADSATKAKYYDDIGYRTGSV